MSSSSVPPPVPPAAAEVSLEARAIRKARRRILPYLFILYVIAYIDRVNVAFAKQAMSADLGFSEAVFALGASLFFLGYFLLEIPGALIVERWSARKWIARILISWGACTVLIGFADTAREFYFARFLLGAAEAGFFPGVIVYLTHWFPLRYRSRAMSAFILAVPLSFVFGAPLSGLLLRVDWLGVEGWRWVFIIEGMPAIVFGIITPWFLKDHPREAKWLGSDERQWLEEELSNEKRQKTGKMNAWRALKEPVVLRLAAALFLSNVGTSSLFLWMPSIMEKASGLDALRASVFSALPFAIGMAALITGGRSSDRTGERRLHASVPLIFCGLFFAGTALVQSNLFLLVLLTCLSIGSMYASIPAFWVLPTTMLGEAAAATAIGLINSVGNLGGFFGPNITGQILARGYPLPVAMITIGGFIAMAGLLIATVPAGRRTVSSDVPLIRS